ncbi:molybdopterin-dependent oxidoreductase [Haladaptatus sp. DYF46]|uniref:molybdopterin-dependent oxidoreductase n=1 Tax=Haladaptatus sp. DYF46 TaxID=2886041 RepID=UPI001E530E4D|nr:molybdopterin-dependent oxidoreductase [Haladaptatus sp. DYF46]
MTADQPSAYSLVDVATDGAIALLAGVAAVAGSYAVVGFTPSFVVAPVSAFVVETTPSAVIAWSIQTLGDLGDQLGFLLALVLTTLLFAVTAAVGTRIADAADVPAAPVAGLLCVAPALALTGAPVSALAAGAGAGIVVAAARFRSSTEEPVSETRRSLLRALVGAVAVGGVGGALGAGRGDDTPKRTGPVSGDVQSLLDEADAKSLAIGGLEGLVSSEFYQVDINSVDPVVSADDWELTVTGAVEEELHFTLDDLKSMSEEHRFITLRCVGESLNGKKMDNALWTGVPISALFEGTAMPDECCVMFRAADDYYEEFPLAALEDGFLAYEMNGNPLPRSHGHPVRALIPGHWGEINVKWLSEIEVLEQEADGYWEKRGWHGTGPVNTVAKLHAVNHLDGGRVQVGGHAYAGTRGIERVEVSTDGGGSWTDAKLSEPLPGTDVWRQWEHTYEASGAHDVVVRATDGRGNLQSKAEANAYPNGATGWVSERIEP